MLPAADMPGDAVSDSFGCRRVGYDAVVPPDTTVEAYFAMNTRSGRNPAW